MLNDFHSHNNDDFYTDPLAWFAWRSSFGQDYKFASNIDIWFSHLHEIWLLGSGLEMGFPGAQRWPAVTAIVFQWLVVNPIIGTGRDLTINWNTKWFLFQFKSQSNLNHKAIEMNTVDSTFVIFLEPTWELRQRFWTTFLTSVFFPPENFIPKDTHRFWHWTYNG